MTRHALSTGRTACRPRVVTAALVLGVGVVCGGAGAWGQASGPAASAPAGPAGCTSAESRQFDFWVGSWDVFAASDPDRKIAESVIEKLYLGCAIRENWRPGAAGGGSLSAWVPGDPGWRQTWVDSSGAWVEFRGGMRGQAMVLQGVWPQPGQPRQIMRMTYTVRADGSVQQRGDTSDDEGRSWQPNFDFLYRRKGR